MKRNRWTRVFGLWATITPLALVVVCGCGGNSSYEGPRRIPVQGTVTFEGKPLPYGVMNFESADGGRAASGLVVDGKFTIDEAQAPNAGKYKVQIVGYAEPPAPPKDGDEGGSVGAPIVQETKEVEVTAEGAPLDIALGSGS